MPEGLDDPNFLFFHVRMVLGMVTGLALAHLLRGAARIIEHPRRARVYWVHLVWAASMFLYLIHFWWWELLLSQEGRWTFNLYAFVVLYALLLYFLCVLLFPEDLSGYDDYRAYFFSRRAWFFSVLAVTYVIDFYDTGLKGASHFESLGFEYTARNLGYVVMCVAAVATRNAIFHALFAVAGVLFQVWWVFRSYEVLG